MKFSKKRRYFFARLGENFLLQSSSLFSKKKPLFSTLKQENFKKFVEVKVRIKFLSILFSVFFHSFKDKEETRQIELKFRKMRGKDLSSQIFNLRKMYQYRIRLLRAGRKTKSFYKIVVVDWNNRLVEAIGSYDPHKFKEISIEEGDIKVIRIKVRKVIFWLHRGATLSPFMHKLLLALDLLKSYKQ